MWFGLAIKWQCCGNFFSVFATSVRRIQMHTLRDQGKVAAHKLIFTCIGIGRASLRRWAQMLRRPSSSYTTLFLLSSHEQIQIHFPYPISWLRIGLNQKSFVPSWDLSRWHHWSHYCLLTKSSNCCKVRRELLWEPTAEPVIGRCRHINCELHKQKRESHLVGTPFPGSTAHLKIPSNSRNLKNGYA